MKPHVFLISLAAVLWTAGLQAQTTRIFRCGNTYTNDAAEAQTKHCKPIEGGNITIVEGTRVNPVKATTGAAAPQAANGAALPGQRVDPNDQRARDSDARMILEAELRKAESRHAELQKEYNNGEPEKLGPETRNYQKYLDRVAELKASIARNEADMAGIRRELSRLTASK
ncbi:MAG TPA: hypothetical protein VLJ86_13130 [Ramlibacter sp.]|nr:hypothetical protein [Ramlibacter sp.]